MLNGMPVTGMVRSVTEHHPMRWTVTVVAKEGRASPLVGSRSGHQRSSETSSAHRSAVLKATTRAG
jgi:hypothetical protein